MKPFTFQRKKSFGGHYAAQHAKGAPHRTARESQVEATQRSKAVEGAASGESQKKETR